MATAFLGSFEASFDRLWAYSAAVIPGVTVVKCSIRVCSPGKAFKTQSHILRLSTGVDEFHVEVGQTGVRRPRPKCSDELQGSVDSPYRREDARKSCLLLLLILAIGTRFDMISCFCSKCDKGGEGIKSLHRSRRAERSSWV